MWTGSPSSGSSIPRRVATSLSFMSFDSRTVRGRKKYFSLPARAPNGETSLFSLYPKGCMRSRRFPSYRPSL